VGLGKYFLGNPLQIISQQIRFCHVLLKVIISVTHTGKEKGAADPLRIWIFGDSDSGTFLGVFVITQKPNY
jgi:hypothetical protein